jgi:hypothetical protein
MMAFTFQYRCYLCSNLRKVTVPHGTMLHGRVQPWVTALTCPHCNAVNAVVMTEGPDVLPGLPFADNTTKRAEK